MKKFMKWIAALAAAFGAVTAIRKMRHRGEGADEMAGTDTIQAA